MILILVNLAVRTVLPDDPGREENPCDTICKNTISFWPVSWQAVGLELFSRSLPAFIMDACIMAGSRAH